MEYLISLFSFFCCFSRNPKLKVYKLLNEYNYINHQKMFPKDLILKYLNDFNLPEDVLYKNINQLSGGQKQLILIIRSLLVKPDLMILDEPTSSLDVTTQKTLLNLLKKIKEKYGLTYILISHNIEVIKYMCVHEDIFYLEEDEKR